MSCDGDAGPASSVAAGAATGRRTVAGGAGLLFLFVAVVGVPADAGVFLVLAGRALLKVHIELLVGCLAAGTGLDAHGDGVVIALGQRVAGDELAAVFLELELRGLAAVARGDSDDLAAELGRFGASACFFFGFFGFGGRCTAS